MPPAHLQARLAAPNGVALGGRQPLGLVGSTATSAGPGYRLQSMYWLITWSRVDAKFDEPVAEQKLRGLVPGAEQGLRVKLAHEEHDDGGPHYHAFVAFRKTPSIRNAQVKLTVGENKPHFTKVNPRMKHVACDYVGRADKRGACMVCNDFDIGWHEAETPLDLRPAQLGSGSEEAQAEAAALTSQSKADTKYRFILQESATPDEFLANCAKYAPSDYCRNHINLVAASKHAFARAPEPYQRPSGLVLDTSTYPAIEGWLNDELKPHLGRGPSGIRGKSLCLWGPSRTGKTTWVKNLGGTFAYMGNHFNVDEFNPKVNYLIFDDISGGLDGLPSYKSWLGCQARFHVTDKYRAKTSIEWGRLCVYLSNHDPRKGPRVSAADRDWLNRNLVFQYIDAAHPLVRFDPACAAGADSNAAPATPPAHHTPNSTPLMAGALADLSGDAEELTGTESHREWPRTDSATPASPCPGDVSYGGPSPDTAPPPEVLTAAASALKRRRPASDVGYETRLDTGHLRRGPVMRGRAKVVL
ncbi:replication associated protein [Sparassis crispa]|uniref:Replication associated protein n=1 Tax=Sparassis crispa TaxID=139825 RepID=A0A401H2Q0_9APHY|nr:replication associated protein [Sparassis crispa]GBE88640.1 replication associated protein [Sparassis crispa]